MLVQVGGGEVWGLTTGAKALFCFTADTMLAGEKEKMPEELLQLEGRLVEEAMVGLDGTTERSNGKEKSVPLMASCDEKVQAQPLPGQLARPSWGSGLATAQSPCLIDYLRIPPASMTWYLSCVNFKCWSSWGAYLSQLCASSMLGSESQAATTLRGSYHHNYSGH